MLLLKLSFRWNKYVFLYEYYVVVFFVTQIKLFKITLSSIEFSVLTTRSPNSFHQVSNHLRKKKTKMLMSSNEVPKIHRTVSWRSRYACVLANCLWKKVTKNCKQQQKIMWIQTIVQTKEIENENDRRIVRIVRSLSSWHWSHAHLTSMRIRRSLRLVKCICLNCSTPIWRFVFKCNGSLLFAFTHCDSLAEEFIVWNVTPSQKKTGKQHEKERETTIKVTNRLIETV